MFKQALVIAGGAWQKPVIEYLQQNNYKVTVADPYDTSPGVLVADEHIRADVRDAGTILKATAGRRFDLVTTDQSDVSVKTVAILAQHFGIRGNMPETVDLFTNKYLSRIFAEKHDIPVPAYRKAGNLDEVKTAINQMGLPVMLKPADSQSSRGISKIDESNINQLEEAVTGTFSATKESYILVESFFEGMELTAEGICSGGLHKTIAISQKKHFRTGIASDLEYPARIPGAVESEIKRINDLYVEQSGLETAITHAEYLYNPATGNICLVEIACRGGGTLISSDIARWVSGIDLYKILIDGLNGIVTDVKALQPLKRNALLHFFEFPNGTVEKIEGIEQIRQVQGVQKIQLDFKEGDIIRSATDDRSRQGFVVIYAESREELDNKFNLVGDLLKISIRAV